MDKQPDESDRLKRKVVGCEEAQRSTWMQWWKWEIWRREMEF